MRIPEAIAVAVAGLVAAGCGHPTAAGAGGGAAQADTLPVASVLQLPEIPDLLTGREARAEYAAERFFGPLAVADTSEAMEQNLANFAALAAEASGAVRRRAFAGMWAKTPQPMAGRLAEIVEDYYYNPESPVYSSDMMLDALIAADSAGLKAGEERRRLLIDELRRNAPGTRAADIAYTDRKGRVRRLLDPGPMQLLIFYDPDCDHCAEEMAALARSGEISRAVADGRLRVTAIYPGADIRLWREHMKDLPEEWTTGMNADNPVGTQDGYIIRTTPQICLIGSDGIVIRRDMSAGMVMEHMTKE